MINPMSEQDMNKSAEAEEIPLLTPYNMGIFNLSHRVVLAPMTRLRCEEFSPQQHVGLYYSQRTTQGGFLISEATAISDTAQGSSNTPGIWKKEQVEAWKPIVNAVHHKGGIFFCQIRHEGKFSANEKKELGRRVSDDEIKIFVEDFKAAARNAMEAGFDGVEIHAGHGYLLDQFLKAKLIDDDADNNGSTLENRCRFPLQVVKAVADEIGAERVGVRVSPFAGEAELSEVLAGALRQIGVVYCHVMRPFQLEGEGETTHQDTSSSLSLLAMRDAFQGTFIVSGGYDRSEGNHVIHNGAADLVAYGRMFLANPDLPTRFRLNAQLNNPHPSTFAILHPVIGYTDYPFLSLPST